MSDQTIQYDEEMVGAGHPTKSDTLNRLALVEADTDGHGKARFLKEQAAAPTPGDNEGVLYTADDGGDTCLYYKAGIDVVELARPGRPFMPGYDGIAPIYSGDLDDLTTGGFYYAGSSTTNKPEGNNGYVVVFGTSDQFATQVFYRFNSPDQHTRRLSYGVWTDWAKVVTTADYTNSLVSPSGYTVLPNGLIIQYGGVTQALSAGNTSISQTFPLAFPTSCLSIVASVDSGAYPIDCGVDAHLNSKTQFTLFCSVVAANDYKFRWIAIGH